jgi:hypothetical protein
MSARLRLVAAALGTALCLAPNVSAAAGPETPVVLRYGFRQGPPLKYRTEVTQRLVVRNSRGKLGNLDVKSTYTMDLAQKVQAVLPNHEYELHTTPESVKVDLDGPMAKSSSQIADVLRKVALTMKVDWRGRVSSLAEAQGTPDAAKKMVATLKNALAQLLPMLPDGPQAPGSRWRQEITLPVDLPTGDKLQSKLTVDYVLAGYTLVDGRTCADVRMRLHMGLAGAMGNAAGRVSVTGEGGGRGFAFIDPKEGLLVASALRLTTRSTFQSATIEVQQTSDVTSRTTLRK